MGMLNRDIRKLYFCGWDFLRCCEDVMRVFCLEERMMVIGKMFKLY